MLPVLINQRAIKRAKELAKAEKLYLHLMVWNMLSFPYPYGDASFSAVVSTKVIHHALNDDINKMVAEITRITRERGCLVLQVPTLEKLARLEIETTEKMKRLEDGTVLFLGGDERSVIHHYFAKNELLSTFSEFQVLDLHTREEHYCLTAIKR